MKIHVKLYLVGFAKYLNLYKFLDPIDRKVQNEYASIKVTPLILITNILIFPTKQVKLL